MSDVPKQLIVSPCTRWTERKNASEQQSAFSLKDVSTQSIKGFLNSFNSIILLITLSITKFLAKLDFKAIFAPISIFIMKIIANLAFFTGLSIPYVAGVPAPAPPLAPDIEVTPYPNGLPAGLYPGSDLTSRTPSFEKRDPPSADVSGGAEPKAGVYMCSDNNFSGTCVYIRSALGQCGGKFFIFSFLLFFAKQI